MESRAFALMSDPAASRGHPFPGQHPERLSVNRQFSVCVNDARKDDERFFIPLLPPIGNRQSSI